MISAAFFVVPGRQTQPSAIRQAASSPPLFASMRSGNQVMVSGQARKIPSVITSVMKNGPMPLKTSDRGISGRTPATTQQFSPMGGVIRQTSDILTTMMPNQIGS